MINEFVPPEKDYFTIEEVAEKWRTNPKNIENYIYSQKILKLAMRRGDIQEYITFDSRYSYFLNGPKRAKKEIEKYDFPRFLYIDPNETDPPQEFDMREGCCRITHFLDLEQNKYFITRRSKRPMSRKPDAKIEAEDTLTLTIVHCVLVVTREERNRFENVHSFPNQLNENILDPNHLHYSETLAIAITVWNKLAKENITKKSPKQRIKEILKQDYSSLKLSRSAIDQIAFVINWEKTGGSPIAGTN